MNYKNIFLLAFLLPISVTEAKNKKTTSQEEVVTAQAIHEVMLYFHTCLLERPLGEGAVRIPSACTEFFKKFNIIKDAMKAIEEDTTQN